MGLRLLQYGMHVWSNNAERGAQGKLQLFLYVKELAESNFSIHGRRMTDKGDYAGPWLFHFFGVIYIEYSSVADQLNILPIWSQS